MERLFYLLGYLAFGAIVFGYSIASIPKDEKNDLEPYAFFCSLIWPFFICMLLGHKFQRWAKRSFG